MTTKIFQRILATFLVVAAIFLANGLNNVANAARVQIYDGNVNDILNDIKKFENNIKKYKEDAEFKDYMIKSLKEKGYSDIQIKELMNIDLKLRGTHYYTGTDGFRYCESYFGDSDKNRLVFQVNNNGAVSSAWIIFPLYTLSGGDNYEGITGGGLATDSIFDVIGLSDSESDNIMDNYMHWVKNMQKKFDEGKIDEVRSSFPKDFSVWCTKSKRYINLNVSFNNIESADKATINLFIYANT